MSEAKKKNLQSDLRKWVKHWYLGGGSNENRAILTPDARAEEKIAYRMIMGLPWNHLRSADELCKAAKQALLRLDAMGYERGELRLSKAITDYEKEKS